MAGGRGDAREFKWKRRSSINVRLSAAHVIIIKLTRQSRESSLMMMMMGRM